jgi:hypothetical protein
VDSTVFRKLAELSYRTSYSHRSRYYTLDEVARFDDLGLWCFRSVWFSTYGTLLSTIEALVEASEAGYYASELENVLHVGVKAPPVKLVREGRLARHELLGRYLYRSVDASSRKRQWAARQLHEAEPSSLGLGAGVRALPEELKAAIVPFYSPLAEHRLFSEIRRNWAGRPLDRYDTILRYAASTTTSAGLEVKAYLVRKHYPKGIQDPRRGDGEAPTSQSPDPTRAQLHPESQATRDRLEKAV